MTEEGQRGSSTDFSRRDRDPDGVATQGQRGAAEGTKNLPAGAGG